MIATLAKLIETRKNIYPDIPFIETPKREWGDDEPKENFIYLNVCNIYGDKRSVILEYFENEKWISFKDFLLTTIVNNPSFTTDIDLVYGIRRDYNKPAALEKVKRTLTYAKFDLAFSYDKYHHNLDIGDNLSSQLDINNSLRNLFKTPNGSSYLLIKQV